MLGNNPIADDITIKKKRTFKQTSQRDAYLLHQIH